MLLWSEKGVVYVTNIYDQISQRVKAYPFGSKEPHSMHEGFRTFESKKGIMLMSCY